MRAKSVSPPGASLGLTYTPLLEPEDDYDDFALPSINPAGVTPRFSEMHVEKLDRGILKKLTFSAWLPSIISAPTNMSFASNARTDKQTATQHFRDRIGVKRSSRCRPADIDRVGATIGRFGREMNKVG
jgi:hypothetical protein